MNFKLPQELGGSSAKSWLVAGGMVVGKYVAVMWDLCVPCGIRFLFLLEEPAGFPSGTGPEERLSWRRSWGSSLGDGWVGAGERLWGQQGRGGARADTRDEGADTSLGSDRQRRTLSSKKLHFFEGNISFILVLLSTQRVQTVDVLPFLKAC